MNGALAHVVHVCSEMHRRNLQSQPESLSDSALVALGKAGDPCAIDQLVNRYWGESYAVAARLLHCHEDAEEVAQEALWAAVRHLNGFREDACFRTWLHHITVNHGLMALRRKRSCPLHSAAPLVEEHLPPSTLRQQTPEDLAIESEQRAVVETALDRIPGFYSVVLRLRVSDAGLATTDISGRLGISKGAIKTRLHRGRKYLQEELTRMSSVRNRLPSVPAPRATAMVQPPKPTLLKNKPKQLAA